MTTFNSKTSNVREYRPRANGRSLTWFGWSRFYCNWNFQYLIPVVVPKAQLNQHFLLDFDCTDDNSILVACLNMPTLPNNAHPRDFNENKLIVQQKCHYVIKGCKRHYVVKNGKIPSSALISITI